MSKKPKLRAADKYKPPYPLNAFPKDFAVKLGKEIVYLLATRKTDRLEGSDWEEIFAGIIGAQWKPSNVGLDDIVLNRTAWGAKSVKNKKPSQAQSVRLISGRCSPVFSYGDSRVARRDPNELGEKVLGIFNERVAEIKKHYKHIRTIVLIKGEGLLELSVFEFETQTYRPDDYDWAWNKSENLVGCEKVGGFHKFTWQPHGSQFTIIEKIPGNRLSIRIRQPQPLDKENVLKEINFNETWVEILK